VSEPIDPNDPGGAGPPSDDAAAIRRIEDALRELGATVEPPVGWEERVLAGAGAHAAPEAVRRGAVDDAAAERRRRQRRFAAVAVAVAVAVLVVVLAWPSRPEGIALAVVTEPTGAATRGPSGQAGDVVHATVRGGTHRAVWIYRDEAELVARCPGDAGCRTDGDALRADVALPLGRYIVVGLAAAAPLPAPTGSYDRDIAALRRAGAEVRERTMTLR
jgi:hypothetical protein